MLGGTRSQPKHKSSILNNRPGHFRFVSQMSIAFSINTHVSTFIMSGTRLSPLVSLVKSFNISAKRIRLHLTHNIFLPF